MYLVNALVIKKYWDREPRYQEVMFSSIVDTKVRVLICIAEYKKHVQEECDQVEIIIRNIMEIENERDPSAFLNGIFIADELGAIRI